MHGPQNIKLPVISEAKCSVFNRKNIVGINTSYGLEGWVFETRWRRGFLHTIRLASRPTQLPAQWMRQPGRGIGHPPHLSPGLGMNIRLLPL